MDETDPSALAPANQSIPGMIDPSAGNIDQYLQMQRLANQLGGSSADPEKKATLKNQAALADYLRNGPNMPKGTYVPGFKGGVYVGPSALSSLASGAQFGLGAMMQEKGIGDENHMNAQEAQNRKDVMNMLAQQNMHPGMYSPDMQSMSDNFQEPDYHAMGLDSTNPAPRNTNLQPAPATAAHTGVLPPRQMSADELSQLLGY